MKIRLVFCVFAFFFVETLGASSTIVKFTQAKKYLKQHLDLYDHQTIYCSCKFQLKAVDIDSCGYKVQSNLKRAQNLEWEHVVPAEAFGKSFAEWGEGAAKCFKRGKRFKGRRCAETNPQFAKMEADLYNLFPEVGELNGLRSNFSMAALSTSERNFGNCKAKLADHKFEPQESSKGIVARTYLNFEARYPGHGIVSEKNRKLFKAWDVQHPVTPLECRRWQAFAPVTGYQHLMWPRCSPSQ